MLNELPFLRNAPKPRLIAVLRLVIVLLLVGQLFVTATVQRRDLLHPTRLGSDASNYLAAGLRLNAGHPLYGPLRPGDRLVPNYPEIFPAPLLSPPLIAVIWRPLAVLPGGLAMILWWFGGLVLVVGLVLAFTLVGRPPRLAALAGVLVLGLPLTILAGRHYLYLGYNSPISIAALSGNVNTYIVGLYVITWWASSRNLGTVAGSAAALAAVLKLGPVMLLWWFVTRRSWPSVRAFLIASAVLGIVGVVFAGFQANVDYLRLALAGGIAPAPFSLPSILHALLGVATGSAQNVTIVAVVIGMVAIWALRERPRAAFAAVILTTIFSSPVVLEGNFALLIALAAPWVIPGPAQAIERGIGDDAPVPVDRSRAASVS